MHCLAFPYYWQSGRRGKPAWLGELMGQRCCTRAVTGDLGLSESWCSPQSPECLFRDNAKGSLNLVTAEIKDQPAAVAGRLEKAHFCSVRGRRPVLGEGQCPSVWHGGAERSGVRS